MDNQQMQVELIGLLNQLAFVQKQMAMVMSAIYERETMENLQNRVEEKKDNIENEVKRYGQNPGLADQALQCYMENLGEVRDEFSNEKNMWLIENGEFEQNEFNNILEIGRLQNIIEGVEQENSELRQTNENKKVEQYKNKINEMKENVKESREASKKARENIEDSKERCNQKIDEISQDTELVKSENKGLFSKLYKKIMDRVGGKEKFNQNVVEPLKDKATHIKEDVLPKVKSEIQENVIPKVKSLYEKGKEKINEMNIPEKCSKLYEQAKEGSRVILEKASGLKQTAVELFSKGMDMAKEGISVISEKIAEAVESAQSR